MIRSGFLTAEERQALLRLIRRASGSLRVGRRAYAILHLDDGLTFEEVARVLFMDDEAVRIWHRKWVEKGIAGLSSFEWKGSSPRLTSAQESLLAQKLEEEVFTSSAQINALVVSLFGVSFSRSGMIKLLDRLDFEYKKPKGLPRGASVAAQEEFVRQYEALLNGLMPDETVYFCDAVHPEYQSRPAHGWVRKGQKLAVQKTSGRKRLNLHGALCLETAACPIVEGDAICAETTIRLLKKIIEQCPKMRVIHVFMDNARYHHARAVQVWLKTLEGQRIKLHFLPSYAPNLNAIERLWAAMHQHVTHNRFYADFEDFAAEIRAFFKVTLPKKWNTLRDRINDTFHIIDPTRFRVLT